MRDRIDYPFDDPIHPDAVVTLEVHPDERLFDALFVRHPDCAGRATVSADLDAFYCTSCGWNGRISGAWAVSKWDREQRTEP